MIEELGYTRIGMIGGPDSNYDAKERRRTYIEVLEAHGIEFDPGLYVEGNLTSESKEVFRDILDRNPDMQGVFCVNDSCASGFMKNLRREIFCREEIYQSWVTMILSGLHRYIRRSRLCVQTRENLAQRL